MCTFLSNVETDGALLEAVCGVDIELQAPATFQLHLGVASQGIFGMKIFSRDAKIIC